MTPRTIIAFKGRLSLALSPRTGRLKYLLRTFTLKRLHSKTVRWGSTQRSGAVPLMSKGRDLTDSALINTTVRYLAAVKWSRGRKRLAHAPPTVQVA